MILRSPAEDENGRILFDPQTTISEEVRHSRMLFPPQGFGRISLRLKRESRWSSDWTPD
jgi:hypothetical protein